MNKINWASLALYLPAICGLFYVGHTVLGVLLLIVWIQVFVIKVLQANKCDHQAVEETLKEKTVMWRYKCSKCGTGLGVPLPIDFYERMPPPPPLKTEKA